MASIYDLKPTFQGLLSPVLGALGRAAVTPNQVTVAALSLSFINGAAGRSQTRMPARTLS